MCNCIDRVNSELKEQAPNTMLLVPMMLRRGTTRLFVETTKRDDKKRGKPTRMFATFCPFCGVKYEKEASDAT